MATDATLNTAIPENRRWQRSHLTVPVRITIEKSSRLSVITTRGSRMNNGGLAVRAETELTIGDEAEIKFTPPHFYPFVRLRGVVRNRVDDVYGVEFLSTSAEEERQLGFYRRILARWGA
jgi:PilZ domain